MDLQVTQVSLGIRGFRGWWPASALPARPASGYPLVGLLNVLQRARLREPLSRVAQRTQVVSRFRRFVTRTYA